MQPYIIKIKYAAFFKIQGHQLNDFPDFYSKVIHTCNFNYMSMINPVNETQLDTLHMGMLN